MNNFEYIRNYYNVPAEMGRVVSMGGRQGVIAEDQGNYIGVLFDDDKPGNILTCHPTWKIEYFDEIKPIRQEKLTRAQKR
jgi:hypothetical protein